PQLPTQTGPILPGLLQLFAFQMRTAGDLLGSTESRGIEQAINTVKYRLIQGVCKRLANQLVGDQVGSGIVQWNQRAAQLGEVTIIDLLNQTLGQIGIIKQGGKSGLRMHRSLKKLHGDSQ